MAVARLVYGLCYLVLLVMVLAPRTHRPVVEKSNRELAAEMETSGRFAVAGRMHARAGRPALGAQAAQRGGDVALAARLYREAGDPLKAGDMYFRAGNLEEAVRQYEAASAHGAAARVYEQLGRAADAAAAWERAGNLPAAVRALESAGERPPAELLYRSGRVRDAVAAWEAEGSALRAAEILEQELGDLLGAARCYLHARQPRRAGELLERLGRQEEAIDAFCFAPDGWFDALRLTVDSGQLERAEAMLAQAPPGAVEKVSGERELLTLARLHERAGRTKAAIGILQRARRLEAATGATHLMLGRLLLGDGLGELAEQELRAAAEMPLDPVQQTEAAYLLGCVLESQGRQAEACEIFGELAQKDLSYRDVEERYRRLRAASPLG
jgi:tetratricopeptide (TPR) repeat protein